MLWLYINRHRWILNRNEMMYFCIHFGLVVFGVVVVGFSHFRVGLIETDLMQSLSGVYSSFRSIYRSLSEGATGNALSPIDSSL